jgi:tetratricopeptide (TPR) repeat protein
MQNVLLANLKIYLKNFLLVIFILFGYFGLAQNKNLDSLRHVLKTEHDDTNKINTLNILTEKLLRIGKYDTSLTYANNAQTLAEKLGFKKGKARACQNIGVIYLYKSIYPKALEYCNKALVINQEIENKNGTANDLGNIGVIYYYQSNYPKALEYYEKALVINQKIGNKNGIIRNLGNIGGIYEDQGNYPMSLEYYFKALAIEQKIGNKNFIASDLGNIGLVYNDQGNYLKALDFDNKALAINREIGNKNGIAINLGNIGIIYYAQRNYSKALEYDDKALAMFQEIENKTGIANNLANIGNIYADQRNYNKALEYDFKALEIDQEIENKNGIAINLCNIGSVYTKQKNYIQAKPYLDSALNLSKNIGEKETIKGVYSARAELDSIQGNYKTGWENYKIYINYRDSLINEANTKKTVQAQMNYDFEQKQAAEKSEQDKKDAVAEQERKRQLILRNSFMGGFALMITLAFFIFRGYRQKQKTNIIITQQKSEVEKQKDIIEEKNKSIIDSITYARRIQHSLLPTEKYIDKTLKRLTKK